MRNEKEKVQYIWHDGATIPENLLISMAKNAGTYDSAKGYIMSLMAHGLMYGITDYINKVNEIREHYRVMPIPVPKGMGESSPKQMETDAMARKKYQAMKQDEREIVIGDSLYLLTLEHDKLFKSKNDWLGIYLVIKDRVDGSMSRSDFAVLAKNATPSCWPSELQIGDRTLSNFARCIAYEDRFEAYYDMDNNPWEELCETFWDILKHEIMAPKSTHK